MVFDKSKMLYYATIFLTTKMSSTIDYIDYRREDVIFWCLSSIIHQNADLLSSSGTWVNPGIRSREALI
jgi:hypothetical protein